ncbi:hypothetical protein [Lacinutrix sp. MedPE-SW]|uniref:hypothetical protein n=1 Tax=Lacinutrix sp. MedPE-SW TaxID=1860087 RepID=UPI0009178150|nr:hypothetical protein [Lacinutrix sp. MedPE-SW]OIQ22877.1 MAG: hypothetical protein BM549_04955 [Lacinutrix sp. MedPE-SW]
MKKIILINAVIWAIVILLGSFLFKEHTYWKYFFGFALIAASIMNGLLSNAVKKKTKTCKVLSKKQ